MIEFLLFLIIVFALGFVFLVVQGAVQQRQSPVPDEVTRQNVVESATEIIERARMTVSVPRRKVK